MNNEQIKELLISLEDTDKDFSVTQSGKESKKINGLYKPDSFEIIIHNKNFTTENQLIYTAIHEYTHHLISCKYKNKGENLPAKSHSTEFWAKFDDLLEIAVSKNLYKRERSESLSTLISEAKEIDKEIVKLQKKLGLLLREIQKKSDEENVRYEDVITHDLNMTRTTAKKCVESNFVNSDCGQSELETILKTNSKKRMEVELSISNGKTINQAKHNSTQSKESNPIDKLSKEKNRLEKTINQLQQRLEIVMEQLSVA